MTINFYEKYSQDDLDQMKPKTDELFKAYGFTEKNIELIEGYTEGHDLMVVYDNNEVKFEDIQEPGNFWATGIKDILLWVIDANDELLAEEESNDNPNKEKIESLIGDKVILDKLNDL